MLAAGRVLDVLVAQSEPSDGWLLILDKYGLPLAFLALVMFLGGRVGKFLYERRVQEFYDERAAHAATILHHAAEMEVERQRHDAEMAEERAARGRLEDTVIKEAIPALTTATATLQRSSELVARVEVLLPRLEALMLEVARQREAGP